MTFSEVFGYDGSYVVVFQDGTGSVLASGIAEADPATGQADASALKPTEPQRDGYTFAGWSVTDDVLQAISGNLVVTAQWEASEYNVQLKDSANIDTANSTVPAQAKTGDNVQVTLAAADGYEVTGAAAVTEDGVYVPVSLTETSGNSCVFSFTMPGKNVIITANVREKGNEVKFMTDDNGVWIRRVYRQAWESVRAGESGKRRMYV